MPTDADSDDADGEETEWKYSLDDLEPLEDSQNGTPEVGVEAENASGESEPEQRERPPLEPGDINLENAIFVALGVFLVLGLIAAAYFGI